jgi:hypothetical protein
MVGRRWQEGDRDLPQSVRLGPGCVGSCFQLSRKLTDERTHQIVQSWSP